MQTEWILLAVSTFVLAVLCTFIVLAFIRLREDNFGSQCYRWLRRDSHVSDAPAQVLQGERQFQQLVNVGCLWKAVGLAM